MLHIRPVGRFLIVVFILLAGCAPFTAPSSQPEPATAAAAQANPTQAPAGQPAAPGQSTTQPMETAPPGAPPQPQAASGPVWLRILSPQDGDTVNTAQIKISGEASADAVISINKDILVVGPDQKFEANVNLDPGSNLIEIVASDVNDNEVDLILTVFYEQ